MDYQDDDNDVGESRPGYKNPPKHNRFKPGQSGNPNGRPPNVKTMTRICKDILFEKVPVNRGRRRMTRIEVIIRAVAKKGTQGNSRAYNTIMRWAESCGLDEPNTTHYPPGRGGVVTYSELEAYNKAYGFDTRGES